MSSGWEGCMSGGGVGRNHGVGRLSHDAGSQTAEGHEKKEVWEKQALLFYSNS